MDYQLGQAEAAFADLIWEREPLQSAELVKLGAEKFGWKKSTVYTVLKRLCDKGLFTNSGGCVTSLITKKDFETGKSEKLINESFNGSLPAFIAAFMNSKKISADEADEIQKMIDEYRKKEK